MHQDNFTISCLIGSNVANDFFLQNKNLSLRKKSITNWLEGTTLHVHVYINHAPTGMFGYNLQLSMCKYDYVQSHFAIEQNKVYS